jgi:hypothetical protein
MKVLASYPNGLATRDQIEADLTFLSISGRDWSRHSKRLAAEFPSLNIFSLGLVEQYSFGWRLTKKGFITLEIMEQLVANGGL